jgi:hypothetical protein
MHMDAPVSAGQGPSPRAAPPHETPAAGWGAGGVDTRKSERRDLSLPTLDDLLEEIDEIVRASDRGEIRVTGNWSAGQILDHLGRSIECSLDGFGFKPTLPMRLLAPLARRWILTHRFPSGLKLPARARTLLPTRPATVPAGAACLRHALSRLKHGEQMTRPSPFVGRLTHEQWLHIHLAHAEHHLGFIHPRLP